MGICNNFARLLYSKVKSGKNELPFNCIHPDVVIQDTKTLMIDMTQMLYSACGGNLDAFRYKTMNYSSPIEFLSSNDPIGHVEFDKRTGRIHNYIEQFTIKDVVSLLTQKVTLLWKKWSFESRARGMDCKLKYIFLVLDGDSPVAKSHTKSKRLSRSNFTILNKNMKSWMENNHRIPTNINCLIQQLKTRYYQFEWPNKLSNNFLFGSIQRFLQTKDWKRKILEQLIESFKRIEPYPNCSLYLTIGHTKDIEIPQVINLMSNGDNDNFLPNIIPYKEADVIIPYLWHYVSKNQEGSVCIMSNDSDMIVTLFAIGDPRMKILTKVGSSSSSSQRKTSTKSCFFRKKDKMCLMKNLTAFAVSEDITNVQPQRMLECLIHLTMGGCDYVESFPKCGPVTILRGTEYFLERYDPRWWVPIFSNVIKFLKFKDLTQYEIFKQPDEIVNIPIEEFENNSEILNIVKEIINFIPNTFPIRIKDKIYIVQLKEEEDVGRAIYWYHSQCMLDRTVKKRPFVKDSSFISSMRRRLYYLSVICDTRLDMESIIKEKEFASRFGYDKDQSYSYIDSISF